MHLEFRISCMEGVCSFDAESFIRMHQLQDCSRRELPIKQSLVKLPECGVSADKEFRPQLKLQFVLENLVCIESSVFYGRAECHQHEKQIMTNWDASEIRTKRYYCDAGEAILVSLPFSVVERDVKIRLIQLAPELSAERRACVQSSFPSYFQLRDNDLCLGVAKIGLRELLLINSGVSVALQPKQSMVAAVEALNLNTIATNGMFGKDVGGIAVLTFQVTSVVFDKKLLQLLFAPTAYGTNENLDVALLEDRNTGVDQRPLCVNGEADMNMTMLLELRQHINSLAFHFVLVPYLVLIDAVLCVNDVISWRRNTKTFFLVCVTLLVFLSDMLELGLMLFFLLGVIAVLRTAGLFYRVLPPKNHSVGAVVSLAVGRDNFQPILYGSHNCILNSMVRARLFFSQGLQADCYFELAFVFYRLWRARWQMLGCLAVLLFALLFISAETLLFVVLFAAFTVHPLTLRVSLLRVRRLFGRRLAPGALRRLLRLSRPMRVSRVVLVDEAAEERRSGLSASFPAPPVSPGAWRCLASTPRHTLPYHPAAEEARKLCSFSQEALPKRPSGEFLHVADTSPLPHLNSQKKRILTGFTAAEKTPPSAIVNGGATQAPLSSSNVFSWSCAETFKHDAQQVSLLNFAVIVINVEEILSNNGGKISTASNMSGNSLIVQKLRRILQRARSLDRPPPANLLRKQYQSYFSNVLSALQFLWRQCSLKVYVTPLPSMSTSANASSLTVGGTVKLDHLAHLSCLVERGEDDGITSTLLAHSSQQVLVGKLQPLYHIDNSARALAVLAAYLLQGSRLSVYNGTGNKGCAVIIPLKMGSNDIELAPEPHPCPLSLQKALIDIWKGWAVGDSPILINTDVVMNIILRHREFWGGEGDGLDAKSDHQHIAATSQEESETARDTLKRELQSLNASPALSKGRRTSSMSIANSDVVPPWALGGRQNNGADGPLSEEGKLT